MQYLSVKDISVKFKLSERRVQQLCDAGRIEGVQRISGVWVIPENAKKPIDDRIKIYTDKDGFQYSVSVPDYLLWNGNLVIAESDVRYALIIWIKPFHQGISQGVLFNDYKDLNTQIMLSSSKKAEDQEDQWIVDENSTILTTIFEKANKVWNLGLK